MEYLRSLREKSCAVVSILALLLVSLAAVPALAGGPYESIGAEGIEGLDPDLPIIAASTSREGQVTPGIVTRDARRGTIARVLPDVQTNAYGQVFGIALIQLFDEGEVLMMQREVPVKGRNRSVVHQRLRVRRDQLPSRGIPDLFDAQILINVTLAMAGRARDMELGINYGFNLVTRLHLNELNGEIIRGEPYFRGRAIIAIARYHAAWALLQMAAINFATVEWGINGATLQALIERGIFRAEAAVASQSLSPELGLLVGGLLVARAIWWNTATRPPGFFNANARVDRFRFVMAGFLFVTLADALGAFYDEDFDELFEDVLVRSFLFSSPAALHTFRVNLTVRDLERLGYLDDEPVF